ncbi:MAG: 3-oxoacyl-[acyl-carrier-protein] reductase FabG [Chlamydiia bacterium]|nr:3-oxoacyl-[acyl-carrier-protein] reductase FabG [Chlamydiia bacterium]
MSLRGKSAFVTGGTRGIGRAIVERLLKEGADVAFCGTNEEKGLAVVEELRQMCAEQRKVLGQQTACGSEGGVAVVNEVSELEQKIIFKRLNVSDSDECEAVMAELIAEMGKIDILVNNAGITRDNLFMRMKRAEWEDIISVNLSPVYTLSQLVVRQMMKNKWGRIINISSISGTRGNAGQTNYCAAKAGMIGFSAALAKEVGRKGVTVNCIAPGFIETDMTGALNDTQKEAILSKIPMSILGQPEDIAGCAAFLACDDARFITGQVITVDGGMTC